MENKKFNPVVWFEIYVKDMERATKFYEEVLKIKFQDMSDPTDTSVSMKAFPSADFNFGASGSLVQMAGIKAGGGRTMVYFGCDDCKTEESRVIRAGGKIDQPKSSLGEYGFCSIVSDPEGNKIGLHSMK